MMRENTNKKRVDGSKLEAIGGEAATRPMRGIMGRLKGINLHEQGLSRRYLNLGDDDRVYIRGGAELGVSPVNGSAGSRLARTASAHSAWGSRNSLRRYVGCCRRALRTRGFRCSKVMAIGFWPCTANR